MNINDLKIAIVGATGVVGSAAIHILEERLHPIENIFPLASKRSNGKKIKYHGDNLTVNGDLDVKGNVTLGDNSSDTVTIAGDLTVNGNLSGASIADQGFAIAMSIALS